MGGEFGISLRMGGATRFSPEGEKGNTTVKVA